MEKSAEAFRTISEVSDLLDTPAHVLRFWESRFAQVKPVKRAGGRRYYRPSDVALLGGIRKLLHDDGMTIRGVQKILREQGVRHVAALSAADVTAGETAAAQQEARVVSVPRAAAVPAAPPRGGHWPAAATPDAATPGAGLLPDPDDMAALFDEAPMQVDAPTLPLGQPGNVRALSDEAAHRAAPVPSAEPAPAEGAETVRPPAATMLRAMDALRARDKKSELRVVYSRLTTLRERLAERNGPSSG
ncbi:MAG: MerR family transcriptional regulator [Rhodobacteraceae bacterium]|jgi:DNA-binding transcriptional MerR regulator|uniref:MerR family transcriptional regulator n=1 Tax=Albidovulum sp. TaxID=1872424 RepID=UPI001E0D5778|nr:MerR family transcriptional regulator [uncultured Defluviimonas sp.]MCB2124505.1 MerR family transcriptional regulator [Paracoccaceae bacterium]MCC0068500.1 MerR family transcriptional regulator [Paracoccaceae bacterium]